MWLKQETEIGGNKTKQQQLEGQIQGQPHGQGQGQVAGTELSSLVQHPDSSSQVCESSAVSRLPGNDTSKAANNSTKVNGSHDRVASIVTPNIQTEPGGEPGGLPGLPAWDTQEHAQDLPSMHWNYTHPPL